MRLFINLRTLGFCVTNDIFAENAWYFRNALVRANYNNLIKGIHESTEYLELFLRNLLYDEHHELHNRALHINGLYKDYQKADIETDKPDIQNEKEDIGIKKPDIDVRKITNLGTSRVSDLLKELVNAQIIEGVTGHGKGKYKFCKK